MPEHGIAVECDLGVKHQQLVAILAFAYGKRVNFDLLGISADESAVKPSKHCLRLLGKIARQAKRLCNTAAMVRLEARGWINDDRVDFLGAVMRHVFDVHAAFS